MCLLCPVLRNGGSSTFYVPRSRLCAWARVRCPQRRRGRGWEFAFSWFFWPLRVRNALMTLMETETNGLLLLKADVGGVWASKSACQDA